MKRNILSVITLFIAFLAVAQKARVESFEADLTDLTAAKYSRDDRNGVKCAVVKVLLIADKVEFQGGIIEPVVEKPGEYWVYMPQMEQRLRVLSSSFLPMMVEFPEPLQAGVTYLLTIETPQAAGSEPQGPKMSFLVLKVTPPTARVTVDGVELAVNNGIARKALGNGAHTYLVEAAGFSPESGTVSMTGKREELTVTLHSNKPVLTVEATTPGTEIYINEVLQGTGKWSGELIADSYVVEGRKAGHRTVSRTITLAEGEKHSLTLPELTAVTGSLSVDYEPVGAKIAVDGKQAGISPDIIEGLTVGSHNVEIAADGFRTARLTTQVTEGETASLSGSLVAVTSGSDTSTEGNEKDYKPVKFASGKWGYVHGEQIVIPAQYDWASEFSEGLATVKSNGKMGFIDKNGKTVIPFKYENAGNFNDGMAWVCLNNKYGFIDKEGKTVIPFIYSGFGHFSEGLLPVNLNGKKGYIDRQGNTVIPCIYDKVSQFSDGKAEVTLGERTFYIDKNGNEIGEDKSVNSIENQKAFPMHVTGEEKDYQPFKKRGRYGYKLNGKTMIPAKFQYADYFHEGLARVTSNGKMGFIDKNGNIVIPAVYDSVGHFSQGMAFIEEFYKIGPHSYSKYGYINNSGVTVITPQYESAEEFNNGKARVKLNGRTFYIDKNGNEVK